MTSSQVEKVGSEPTSGARPTGAATLHGRPLLDSRLDMSLYLPRPGAEAGVRRALQQGLNVLVEGTRGSGRTTLLRALLFEDRARDEPWGLRYVRASTATSAAGLVRLVAGHLDGASDAFGDGLPDSPDARGGPGMGDTADALGAIADLGDRLGDLVAAPGAPPRPTVCLDDVDPRLGNQLFGVLRDELWELPMQWVVTTTPDDAAVLLRPPADAFFEARVVIPELSRDEAAALIAMRLGHPVQLPQAPSLRTPREALDLARLAPQQWPEAAAERARRDAQVAELGRPATMLVAALEELGPVSPSDDRLLTRMGWTSSRASQVLRQLLAVGVVAYREVRGERPGRPARLYELTPLRG